MPPLLPATMGFTQLSYTSLLKTSAQAPGHGKSHVVVVPGGFGKRGDDHYILTGAFEPAMKSNHPIRIVDVERIYVVAAQSSVIPAQADQILSEAQMIRPSRCRFPRLIRPSREDYGTPWIPTPLLVFEKLLTHEDLGNAGSGQQTAQCDSRAAARIPATAVAESARYGMRWSVPTLTMSWFSTHGTVCHPCAKPWDKDRRQCCRS